VCVCVCACVCVVVDEATSAVSVSMERTLYTQCARLNITLLSVGHRVDSLRQFHHLQLHVGPAGHWHLLPVIPTSSTTASSGYDQSSVDIDQSLHTP